PDPARAADSFRWRRARRTHGEGPQGAACSTGAGEAGRSHSANTRHCQWRKGEVRQDSGEHTEGTTAEFSGNRSFASQRRGPRNRSGRSPEDPGADAAAVRREKPAALEAGRKGTDATASGEESAASPHQRRGTLDVSYPCRAVQQGDPRVPER